MAASRRPLVDLTTNGMSVLARLASGVLLFVVIGRVLGPAAFGEFVFGMAIASVLAFFSGLGFNQQVLREIAAKPEHAHSIADACATARLIFGIAILAFALTIGVAFQGWWWVLALLVLALMCDGAVEFLFALMRAQGRYDTEARFIAVSSTTHVVVVAAVAIVLPDMHWIALAFALSRAGQLAVAAKVLGRQTRLPQPRAPLRRVYDELRAGWPYTLDAGLSVVGAQLDTIAVRLLFGSTAAGLYQAGMRVVVGLQNFSVVAGNVFIPRLARAAGDAVAWREVVHHVRRMYLALSVGGGAAVLALGWLLTRFGYGPGYESLLSLWPGLAMLLAVRMWAASYGVRLTALGGQSYRSITNLLVLAALVGMIGLASLLGLGLAGVVTALVAAATGVLIAYWSRVRSLESRQ